MAHFLPAGISDHFPMVVKLPEMPRVKKEIVDDFQRLLGCAPPCSPVNLDTLRKALPRRLRFLVLRRKSKKSRESFEKTVSSLTPLAFGERHTWEALRLPYCKGFDEKKHPQSIKSLDARRSKKVESRISG